LLKKERIKKKNIGNPQSIAPQWKLFESIQYEGGDIRTSPQTYLTSYASRTIDDESITARLEDRGGKSFISETGFSGYVGTDRQGVPETRHKGEGELKKM